MYRSATFGSVVAVGFLFSLSVITGCGDASDQSNEGSDEAYVGSWYVDEMDGDSLWRTIWDFTESTWQLTNWEVDGDKLNRDNWGFKGTVGVDGSVMYLTETHHIDIYNEWRPSNNLPTTTIQWRIVGGQLELTFDESIVLLNER